MRILRAAQRDVRDWMRLRLLLWPQGSETGFLQECEAMLADPDWAVFLARADDDSLAGFAEASIRHDCVNGCETRPVGFLEGIHVRPGLRRRGIARSLCRAAEAWVISRDCSEFASDAELGNEDSHRMHAALGFVEMERVVCYRKKL